MQFEHLNTKIHDRKCFNCGIEALNLYLKRVANQDQRRSLTRIYVLSEGAQVIGYYSISAHSVSRDNLPDDIKLANYKDIPFLLLGRLAVDKNFQGKGYGDALIFHAFKITLEAAEKVGILGMVVDAKDENAVSFYEGFGFRRLKGSKSRLILPISIMKSLVKA
ncbi:MAG: GNAT family N-acetyltransferase [Desulfamplus sp.]|nr:GNAT family N-acetyltransferase [Desulfamplus sp.]